MNAGPDMDIDRFQEILRREGRYETPPSHVPRGLRRVLGRTDACYYIGLHWIVVKGWYNVWRGKFGDRAWGHRSLLTLRLAEACGGRITIEGAGGLTDHSGPLVYMANHMSLLETFLLPSILLSFGELAIVVKKSLLYYPFFGAILRSVRPISVTRSNPRQDLKAVLTQGEATLRAGRSVLVFPQSTRSTEVEPESFNTLAVKLAHRAGVPVVPIALVTDFMGMGRVSRDLGPIDRSKPIHFRIGSPITVDGNGRAEFASAVQFIVDNVRRWRQSAETGSAAAKGDAT